MLLQENALRSGGHGISLCRHDEWWSPTSWLRVMSREAQAARYERLCVVCVCCEGRSASCYGLRRAAALLSCRAGI